MAQEETSVVCYNNREDTIVYWSIRLLGAHPRIGKDCTEDDRRNDEKTGVLDYFAIDWCYRVLRRYRRKGNALS